MDNLQVDKKGWLRYYAINAQWVSSWLDYVQSDSKENAVHPGPIRNDVLLPQLLSLKSTQDSAQYKTEFYTVSKHLFYFFHSIYGGGPILVANFQWQQQEIDQSNTKIIFKIPHHEERKAA